VQVYDLELSKSQKTILQCLCTFADVDGCRAYPGNHRIAYMTEYDERHVKRVLKELEEMRIIEVVANKKGGSGRAKEVKIDLEKGVRKTPFVVIKGDTMTPFSGKKGDTMTPFSGKKGDTMTPFSGKGGHSEQKRVTFRAKKGDTMSPHTPLLTNTRQKQACARVSDVDNSKNKKPADAAMAWRQRLYRFEHFILNEMDDRFLASLQEDANRLGYPCNSLDEVVDILDFIHDGMDTGIFNRPTYERRAHRYLRNNIFPEALEKLKEKRQRATEKERMALKQEQIRQDEEARAKENEEKSARLDDYFKGLSDEEKKWIDEEAEKNTLLLGARRESELFPVLALGQRECILMDMMESKNEKRCVG